MGGSGKGSGLEAEQVGDGSPSEPTVLREVELPEPLGEAMVGAAGAAKVGSKQSGHVSMAPTLPHTQLTVPIGLCSTVLICPV